MAGEFAGKKKIVPGSLLKAPGVNKGYISPATTNQTVFLSRLLSSY